MKKQKNNIISLNYYGLLIVVLLFLVIIIKLMIVSNAKLVDGVDIQAKAASRKTAVRTLTASRGEILSSNGETLAKDVNSYTVIAYLDSSRTTNPKYPHHVVDKEGTAETLSKYLNMSKESILYLLNLKGYQVELRPGGLNVSEKLKQEIQALDLPGIDFISSTKRYYPFGDFASYIIGYAKKKDDGSIVGELGVESYFNKELTGENGYTKYQQDAYGYKIADTNSITEPAKSGKDIYLTIDSNVQMYLENALNELTSKYSMELATVTVANARTGAILGSASAPSFDPNVLNITSWNAPLASYTYEPGSTIKIFSFMSAIEEGLYEGDAKYMSGKMAVGKNFVTDWNKTGWGSITYDTGFTYSSNVAASTLAFKLGRDKLVNYYKNFGFGSKTGIEMSNEYDGVINPKYEIELANVAFGQGMTTTPIQIVQALTTLVNSGSMLKPYIVEKIVDHDSKEVLYQAERKVVSTPVSAETTKKVLDLMYETVNSKDTAVTGRIYKTTNTTLAGKTGTAQIPSKKGGYESGTNATIRSFAGVFPYEDPEYIIYIAIKRSNAPSSQIGKQVKSIVESIAKYKNLDQLVVEQDKSKIISLDNYINKNTESSVKALNDLGLNVVTIGNGERIIDQFPEKGSMVVKDNKVFIKTNSKEITMPDTKGWSSNDVNSFCTLVGMNCSINGYGQVISASIEKGEPIDKNTLVEFTLSRKDEDNGKKENGN